MHRLVAEGGADVPDLQVGGGGDGVSEIIKRSYEPEPACEQQDPHEALDRAQP